MKKNSSNLYPFALQDQLKQGLTGQTPSVYISKDGGSFAATTNSPSEFNASTAPGLYTIMFTASECDCDIMIIQVYLPHGQDPAILDVVEMEGSSGATPQQIWEYAGGRTVTNTIPTAQNIWEYSNRTLTASALTAQQVWEYTTRTLTASPIDISSLATSTDVSNAQTAIINAIPIPPSASTIATTVINTSVLDRDTNSLGSTVLAISGYTDEVESKIDSISTKLTDLPVVRSLLDNWVVNGTNLTCYDSEGNTLESCTLTKDDKGNIVAVTPNEE